MMNIKKSISKKIFYKATFSLVALLVPVISFAATFRNPLKFGSLSDFLKELLDVIILLSIPIIVLSVVYSGFLFVSAQGSVDKLDKAKKVIIYTLIGASLILGAKVLSVAIQKTVKDLSIIDKGSFSLILSEDDISWV